MITLTMRPYAGEANLEAIAHLFNACEAVDRLDQGTSVAELRQAFESPSLDKERNMRFWEDANGQLMGSGQMWIPPHGAAVVEGFLRFRVHPNARGSNLEMQVIAWGEERMREVSRERGMSVKLRSSTRNDQAERIALLDSCGFTADRYFLTMERRLVADAERSLYLPIPEPQFPEGFVLRHSQGEQDAEAWVELHNQSFFDHWNHFDLTVEEHKHCLSDLDYRPEHDLIAVSPDGTFAGFCHCHIATPDNIRSGRNEGWVGILGTRRGFRRMGLGRAMLLAGLHQLKAAGVDTAKLGVDSQNANNALRLYESVGFCKAFTRIFYVKDV